LGTSKTKELLLNKEVIKHVITRIKILTKKENTLKWKNLTLK